MKIKPIVAAVVALISALGFCDRCRAQTGDLKITFKLKGDFFGLDNITPTVDKQHCGKLVIPDERLLVNKENQGIKNVVAYVYNHRKGTKLNAQPVPKRKLTLRMKQCRFEPHIVLAQVGDTLKIEDAGPVGHNANVQFLNNQPGLPIPGQANLIDLKETEPTLMPIYCSIHPWMKSYVLIVDHAFYGISDEDGVLEIKDVPVGKKVVFRVWHETGTFKEGIIIAGKEEKWKKNVTEFEIKEGMNDVGVVEVPVGNFRLENQK